MPLVLEPAGTELRCERPVQVLAQRDLHEPEDGVEVRGQRRVDEGQLDGCAVCTTDCSAEASQARGSETRDQSSLFVVRRRRDHPGTLLSMHSPAVERLLGFWKPS
ncbi:hypothetical protein DEJ24_11415 [Curtobacterium sp. MCPF17_001]|nr:hypothetical protein DEJ24_11415 [Curtobacterium sp. MCPF17_001]